MYWAAKLARKFDTAYMYDDKCAAFLPIWLSSVPSTT